MIGSVIPCMLINVLQKKKKITKTITTDNRQYLEKFE